MQIHFFINQITKYNERKKKTVTKINLTLVRFILSLYILSIIFVDHLTASDKLSANYLVLII